MSTLDELGREAALALDGERVPTDRRSHVYSVDLRYQGQNYEINVALSQAMLDMLAAGDIQAIVDRFNAQHRSEEHTSALPSLMRISYAVFCLKKKNTNTH